MRHGMPSYVNHFAFTIRKNQKQEVRVWKIERVNAQLGHARNWRTLRSMQFATKGFRQQPTPQPNPFADMFGQIFAGNPDRPCRPANLTEHPWSMHELQRAVGRMKIKKGADEAGLVAELLKNSLDDLQADLLRLFNAMLSRRSKPLFRVSAFCFQADIHCKTNAGSTHILVALRRGWEKDCCCYVHFVFSQLVGINQLQNPNQVVKNAMIT